MPFLILFIAIPLFEIYLFLAVGDEIGILTTLLLCVVTAMIGGFLVKQQGLETLLKGQQNLQQGNLPVNELYTGFCLIVAGALLMTPGFFTDIVGFLLLTPFFRDFLKKKMLESGKFTMRTSHSSVYQDDDIIEADYGTVEKDAKQIHKEHK